MVIRYLVLGYPQPGAADEHTKSIVPNLNEKEVILLKKYKMTGQLKCNQLIRKF